jgi:hypothetical protein
MAKNIAPKGKPVVAEVVAVEEVKTGGLTFDDGIVLTTFLVLAAALTMVILAVQERYPG